MVELKLTGFEGIEDALKELKLGARKAVTRRVLTRALEPVAAAARALAPVDDGYLRDSITVGTKLTRSAKADAPKYKDQVTVWVGTANRNGVPREFGTWRTAAHPFMRPAWEANKHGVLKTIADDLRTEIERTAARAAKRAGRPK